MGFMDVPKLDPPMGLYMFIVNILAPGFGTMIAAAVFCKPMDTTQLIIGICQLFTYWICGLGWFWSIYWGYLMWTKSEGK